MSAGTGRNEILAAALNYRRRGWQPTPLEAGAKKAVRAGWQNEILDDAVIENAFPSKANVGVRMGRVSGGLVDIDLDSPEAVAMADEFLPRTDAIFGRPGKPRSHRLFKVVDPND